VSQSDPRTIFQKAGVRGSAIHSNTECEQYQ
jgi:hypothetical protein